MPLKQLIYADPKQGKTLYVLSMAAGGALAYADDEYALDWYLEPHPDETVTPFSATNKEVLTTTIRPHIRKLLGLPDTPLPVVYWLQTQEIAKLKNFIAAAAARSFIFGIGIDSLSVVWDLASDTVEEAPEKSGGLAWKEAKRIMRRFQYALLGSKKHYVCTSHRQISYTAQMVITGSGPWVEKKTPHWLDLIGRMEYIKGKPPTLEVMGERSGGLLPLGTKVEAPTWDKVFHLFGGTVPAGRDIPLDATEVEYRNKTAATRMA